MNKLYMLNIRNTLEIRRSVLGKRRVVIYHIDSMKQAQIFRNVFKTRTVVRGTRQRELGRILDKCLIELVKWFSPSFRPQ
jgi:hypothetical protein